MKSVQLAPRCARMVLAWDREMDPRRVDIREGVKPQGRLMRDDTTAQSPRDRCCEIVVLTARQDGHPVHTTTSTLKTPACGQKTELHGVHTDIPRVTSRDVAMLLGGKFNKPIPDSHVLNRIK
ncbi:hypothetical protein LAUMK4_05916 [Mycobacterium persicum]|nr:hypothetical protein A4G28_04070 [Mycobacterium ostraviense]KZS85799.1 hypothetical protein A4G31_03575 [Mycobacterium persicum]VAZ81137.1 hypothetical protein LAUMK15_05724 [Mycobacterium persicum]VBA33326.1 hypothetical protein LAUMK4_05916 [Mycobacterium persicum]